MKKIAFIGVGVMGKSMVKRLYNAGHQVTIYTRTKSKVEDLIKEGILWKDSIQECVKDQDVIMTMVGYPQDVEDIYFGKDGILENISSSSICIDFTTSSPNLAQKIYMIAKEKGIQTLDAPVSGGDIGAMNGTLSIMVGGDEEAYFKVLPLLEILGKSLHYVGKAGLGQHTKMTNQIVIAGTIAGVVEAIHYAQTVSLDTSMMMACISQGAAQSWQLKHNGQAILDQHYDPGFYIKHFIKDMKIAQNEMKQKDVDLEILNQVLNMYEQLNENELGTQALIHYYQKKDD